MGWWLTYIRRISNWDVGSWRGFTAVGLAVIVGRSCGINRFWISKFLYKVLKSPAKAQNFMCWGIYFIWVGSDLKNNRFSSSDSSVFSFDLFSRNSIFLDSNSRICLWYSSMLPRFRFPLPFPLFFPCTEGSGWCGLCPPSTSTSTLEEFEWLEGFCVESSKMLFWLSSSACNIVRYWGPLIPLWQ